MSFRRSAAIVLFAAALVSGCKKVEQESSPSEVIVASFASPLIPNPNDLSLAAAPTLPASAQRTLLQAFVAAGGFPSDQAVSLSIPFVRYVHDEGLNRYVPHAVQIDPATLTSAAGGAATFALLKVDGGTVTRVDGWEFDPAGSVTAADGASWTLAIRSKPSGPPGFQTRRWAPGRYVFAVRGGASGVRTRDGKLVGPDFAVQAALENLPLDNPQHVPIGTPPDKMALLENVRKALFVPIDWGTAGAAWAPTGAWSATSNPFAAIDTVFPARELASFSTFEIAPAIPTAPVDSGSGIAPLPLDLLRTANGGTTIAFNPAFGPAAQGLTSLDGFSTTALVFAPVTVPVDASTVNGTTVHLFKLAGGTATLLKELKAELGLFQATAGAQGAPSQAAYVAEPDPISVASGATVAPGVVCQRTGRCSTIIALQAAVAAPTPLGTFYLPPLDEASDYAVVITTSVKDVLGRPLQKSTVAKILTDPGFDPVATSSVNGVSLLSGIPNETATALRKMREQLVPALAAFRATGKTNADVALAYTFRTQGGMAQTALALTTVPYGAPVGVAPDADAVTTFTPAQAGALYGFDPALVNTLGTIAELAEVKVSTVSWLLGSLTGGAFDPAHPVLETMGTLVVVPQRGLVTGACPTGTGFPAYTTSNCAPLVVFEHGLGSGKAEVIPIAGALAARGFVVVALDMPMHGERSLCSGSGAGAQAAADQMCCPAALCGTASTCAFKPNLSSPTERDAQGNITTFVGVCESAPGVRGRMLNHRVDGPAFSPRGFALASANQFVSLNFFRTRDGLRQNTIDLAAVVKALAPLGDSSDAFASYLKARFDLSVDHTKVFWIGHSGGVFAGTQSLAVNPRITRAVAYAGGATAVDVFANPQSSFHASLVALLGSAGIAEGTSDYLKTLQIAKWILDPADPANFARYVVRASTTPLPNPFAAGPLSVAFPALAAIGASQPAREVLTQISLCDGTVPNAQNTLLSGLLGRQDDGSFVSGYGVPTPDTSTTAHVQWFSSQAGATGGASCPTGVVGHSNPWDFSNPSLAQQAQGFMGGFLASPANVVTPVVP